MSNLAISVDDELIRRAQVRAIQQGTSLSAKVREFLQQYANGSEDLLTAHHCDFGGGTAIVLRYGGHRECAGVDFVVSDLAGGPALRMPCRGSGSTRGSGGGQGGQDLIVGRSSARPTAR